jgi:DNA invertase Pin-like site-specific DNA recombinase
MAAFSRNKCCGIHCDTCVVTRLDRLTRSTRHRCQMTDQLQQKKIQFPVLDQNINTGEAAGRLFSLCLGFA